MCSGLTSVQSILIFGAGLVCYLDAGAPVMGILEQIYIRSLVESVVPWSLSRWPIEVVYITEPGQEQDLWSAIMKL